MEKKETVSHQGGRGKKCNLGESLSMYKKHPGKRERVIRFGGGGGTGKKRGLGKERDEKKGLAYLKA